MQYSLLRNGALALWIALALFLAQTARAKDAPLSDGMRCGVALLSDKRLQENRDRVYTSALGSVGFPPAIVDVADAASIDFKTIQALIVPFEIGNSLSEDAVKKIVEAERNGLCVCMEGQSGLSQGLGVDYLPGETAVNEIVDLRREAISLRWADKLTIREFSAKNLKVFCKDKATGAAVLAGGSLGAGRWLYSAIPLDGSKGWGYGRMPYFHEAFLDWFGLQPPFSRAKLIAYLDFETPPIDPDPFKVAAELKAHGISEIHLSAFFKLDKRRKATLALIDACHRQGILVYCWLELPFLNREFWDAHPEWREHNALGNEVAIEFRYLMALENPACMKAAKRELSGLVKDYPWDGVDVAELYFDTPIGFDAPEKFTPMCQWVRDDYKAKTGVDPIEFFNTESARYYKKDKAGFDRFLKYRSDLLLSLNREIVACVGGVKSGPLRATLPVTLTLVDVLMDEAMGSYIGIEKAAFLKARNEMGFDLQVEDPYTLWSKGPDRYRVIGEAYNKEIKRPSRLTVDINIVDREGDIFPHKKQTGLEFLTLLHEAGLALDQVCIYSAATPYAWDFKYAGAALAGKARLKRVSADECEIRSPYTVVFKTPTRGRRFYLNGQPWPCVSEAGVILPAGESKLKSAPQEEKAKGDMRVTGATCDILGCATEKSGVRLNYNERQKVFVTLDRKPGAVELNGRRAQLPVLKSGGGFTVYCPAGRNEIFFRTGDK